MGIICTLSNFSSFGECITRVAFNGDFTLAAIVLMFVIAALLVRFGMPFEMFYAVAIIFTFFAWMASGSMMMMGIFALTLVIAGSLLGYAVLNWLRGW